MKIATRVALLQWQANVADPANLWRLILAWITPGMREPYEKKAIDWTRNPYQSDKPSQGSAADLLAALGRLMEEHPTALMGTTRLPAPKQEMKTAIKQAWLQEPRLRGAFTAMYLHLSSFQDGIGDAVFECSVPGARDISKLSRDQDALRRLVTEIATGSEGESFRKWIEWSKVTMAEMEILAEEWKQFERSAAAAN
jgi:hypothetical protein